MEVKITLQTNIYTIVIYTKENGESPIKSFIEALETKMKAKVLRFIALLKQNGMELREPYTKSLSDGILELRIIQGNNIVRILYFFMQGNIIVLTNGFVKKSNKTPKKEIELALKYRKDYLERTENEYER